MEKQKEEEEEKKSRKEKNGRWRGEERSIEPTYTCNTFPQLPHLQILHSRYCNVPGVMYHLLTRGSSHADRQQPKKPKPQLRTN